MHAAACCNVMALSLNTCSQRTAFIDMIIIVQEMMALAGIFLKAVRVEMHVGMGKATGAKHRLSYSHLTSSRAGTVAVVDGSQRGALWDLKTGDRPWK